MVIGVVFKETRLDRLLKEVEARQRQGHPRFYRKFFPDERKILHAHYSEQVDRLLPRVGDDKPVLGNTRTIFRSPSHLLLAEGYVRVVIGDYGPYIEFRETHLHLENFRLHFDGPPSRPVKYIWWDSLDLKVKLYEQKEGTDYADYLPEMWYMSPFGLKIFTPGLDFGSKP